MVRGESVEKCASFFCGDVTAKARSYELLNIPHRFEISEAKAQVFAGFFGAAEHLAGKCSFCHPEPAPFACEGSAARGLHGKKQILHPAQRASGVRNDMWWTFSAGIKPCPPDCE